MADNSDSPMVSTGRGGAGNIGHDTHQYDDAGIVREGEQGHSASAEYSSGRGGAGNMVPSPRIGPVGHGRSDSKDRVPEAALIETNPKQTYHTGRGGSGNVHAAHGEDKSMVKEVIDKILHHDKKHDDSGESKN